MNKLRYSQTKLQPNSSFGSERRSWIIEIHNFLEQEEVEEDEEDQDVPVCIFNVPKSLRSTRVDAYTPQLVALGPYHHFRDHLREMERYKLVLAKKVRDKFPNLKIQDLTHHMIRYESKIRACYHKYLEEGSETLALMMVLDGLFLLDFLHIYVDRSYSVLASETKMSHLVDKAGKRTSYDLILRDIFMLENQIPILVLKKLLHVEYSSSPELVNTNNHENLLMMMLASICKELSPFHLSSDEQLISLFSVSSHAHFLDILYHLIVPKFENFQDDYDIEAHDEEKEATGTRENPEEEDTKRIFQGLWSIMSSCDIQLVRKLIKPLKFLVKLPWKYLGKLPGLSIVLPAMTGILFSNEQGSSKDTEGSLSNGENTSQNALADEIMIPLDLSDSPL